MATILLENQLYLYALFSREVGVGRQTMLSRMEEVLLADGLQPTDLGFEDMRGLLEQLDSFVRLSVFKKGRVYATILPQAEWDAILQRVGEEAEKRTAEKKGADKNAGKSWKRKRGKRELRPIKPRVKRRAEPTNTKGQEPADNSPQAVETVDEERPAALQDAPEATAGEAAVPTELATSTEAEVLEEATTSEEAEVLEEATPAEAAPAEAAPAEEAPTEEAAPAEEVAPTEEAALAETWREAELSPMTEPKKDVPPAPAPTPSITFNVTYDPYQDAKKDEETSAGQTFEKPRPAATSPAPLTADTPVPSTADVRFPQDFAHEVLVPNKELSALYQILPLNVDPMALLNADWRVARSTESFAREDAVVVFPLRYFEEKTGERVQVSMRRIASTQSKKRWKVTAIDRVCDVGFEGLPAADNPTYREFAQFTTLGPWDELYARLRELCGDEGLPLSAEELRTYLPLTFHRVRCEHKFVTIASGTGTSGANPLGQLGTFDTGLLAKNGSRILMCFETQDGDIPWRFVDFLTVDQAQVGEAAPLPATYLHTLADIAVSAETSVQIDERLAQAHGAKFKKAAQVALLRAQRDYRLATPAYDPVANVVRLLLPLCLGSADKPSHALVLCPKENGEGFMASAVLSLQHAATCAKVVSFELPRWLEKR